MKLAIIGVGNAGGKITDRLVEFEAETGRSLCRYTAAINTATIDLQKLEFVPEDDHVLIGQTDARSKGHGAGADPDLGREIASQDMPEIHRVLDQVPLHDVDAFLVVAGLGGGTGSGGAPEIASELRERYDEAVYGLGVLPSEDEGGWPSLNAARSLPTFTESVDALIGFDNEAWREGSDTVESGYERTNREIAKRVVTLLAAGEYDGSTVAENAMDSSDVNRTLTVGGISTVAYAETTLASNDSGLLERIRGDGEAPATSADPATRVHSLTRRAVRSRLTLPAEIDSAERVLLVVSGPPSTLSRKGLERARTWLEREIDTVEVLAGDDPRPGSERISATVLLTNVTEVPRIDELQDKAIAAQEDIQRQAEGRDAEIAELITDNDDQLDPV